MRNILRHIVEKLDVKKSQPKSRYVFKNKGNKIQAEFLDGIMAQLSDLKALIKSGSQTRSKNLVKDILKKCEKRVKCVKIDFVLAIKP